MLLNVKAAMTGMLEPTYEEIVLGRAGSTGYLQSTRRRYDCGCCNRWKMVRNAAVRVWRLGDHLRR